MKFTSYKYWINEKFTEESDPITDLNIGIVNSKNAQQSFFDKTIKKLEEKKVRINDHQNFEENNSRFYHTPCLSFICEGFSDIVLVVSDKVLNKVKKFWEGSGDYHQKIYEIEFITPMWVLLKSYKTFKVITFNLENTDKMIEYIQKVNKEALKEE